MFFGNDTLSDFDKAETAIFNAKASTLDEIEERADRNCIRSMCLL